MKEKKRKNKHGRMLSFLKRKKQTMLKFRLKDRKHLLK